MLDLIRLVASFAAAKWSRHRTTREGLKRHQALRIHSFLGKTSNLFPKMQGSGRSQLTHFPIMDKNIFLKNFDAYNRHGLSLEEAQSFALQSEKERRFSENFKGLTVGLSSGTSGRRGVFLASPRERTLWAGILLARMLRPRHARQILNFLKPPLQIAFFLRSDSQLYQTLSTKRIRFVYYDLLTDLQSQIERLDQQMPDILVAPASVLVELANLKRDNKLLIAPTQVISVAETLEPDDNAALSRTFDVSIDQIYQATEGFLGYTCACGRLHLNEAFVHFEKEWLDKEHKRFIPIITDFTRQTQAIIRYRLDDILHTSNEECPCGSYEQVLDHIEGRLDDVLKFKTKNNDDVSIFPDSIRRAFFLAQGTVRDYRLTQNESGLCLSFEADDRKRAEQSIHEELSAVWSAHNIEPPLLTFLSFKPQERGIKRRRILCCLSSSKRRT